MISSVGQMTRLSHLSRSRSTAPFRIRASPSGFWGPGPSPGVSFPPALVDGLLAETLEQLPQLPAHEVSQQGRRCQKGGGVGGGAGAGGLGGPRLLEQRPQHRHLQGELRHLGRGRQ